MTEPLVFTSAEVVRHHLDQHRLHCPATIWNEGTCSCGTTRLYLCTGCGELLYALVDKGTWCEHAEELQQGGEL